MEQHVLPMLQPWSGGGLEKPDGKSCPLKCAWRWPAFLQPRLFPAFTPLSGIPQPSSPLTSRHCLRQLVTRLPPPPSLGYGPPPVQAMNKTPGEHLAHEGALYNRPDSDLLCHP